MVTSTLVFESGGVKEYVGGYDDWVRQRAAPAEPDVARSPGSRQGLADKDKGQPEASAPGSPARKLAYKEKRELESLPKTIEELEARLETLHAKMADPAFYQGPADDIAAATAETSELQSQLDAAYTRWEELEALAG